MLTCHESGTRQMACRIHDVLHHGGLVVVLCFKYVWRCMVKGKTLEDIDKAIDCLYKLRKEIKPYLKSQMKADSIVAGKSVEDR